MDPAMKILTGSNNDVHLGCGGNDGGGEVDGGGGGEDQGTDKSLSSDEDPFRFQEKSHNDKFPPPISV